MNKQLSIIISLILIGFSFNYDIKAGTKAEEYIIELDSKIEWTKHEATRHLGILKNQGQLKGINNKIIVQKLIRNLLQAEKDVANDEQKGCSRVGNLTWALGQFKDNSAIPILIWCLRNNEKAKVRCSSAWAIQCFEKTIVLPLLIQAIRIEKDDKTKNQIGASIEHLSKQEFGFDQSRPNGPFVNLDEKTKNCLTWWKTEGKKDTFQRK